MYFTSLFFLENGIVLQVKSECSKNLQLRNELEPDWMPLVLPNDVAIDKSFKFCQNGNCCSTGILSFREDKHYFHNGAFNYESDQEKRRCKEHNFTKTYELGECGNFNFDFNSVENVIMTHITLHAQGHSYLYGHQFNVSFVAE